jgi:hypothetical protein
MTLFQTLAFAIELDGIQAIINPREDNRGRNYQEALWGKG